MGHDKDCEIVHRGGGTSCECAVRAYERDPMLDENGTPIPLGARWGTMAPWAEAS